MTSADFPISIVHHANQYLITNGYLNRAGLSDILGPLDSSSGLRAILDLHSRYNIPFHLHISGTLIEACAWHDPHFLEEIAELNQAGLVELIGSTYGQNIMPLFDFEHNFAQIQEELYLFQKWLGASPADIHGFWIPERVWNTQLLADVLRTPSLSNGGFNYIFVDDRLMLPKHTRPAFDEKQTFMPELFEGCYIEAGKGLIALPLSSTMRVNIPFENAQQKHNLDTLLSKLRQEAENGRHMIGIYGDDMEKSAGVPPWNPGAIGHYRRFIEWLTTKEGVKPVLLNKWLQAHKIRPPLPIEPGTYWELAVQFGAGEDYKSWADSEKWAGYQQMLNKVWGELKVLSKKLKKESSLLALARKHLLASAYETGWHDAPNSIHSKSADIDGAASLIGSPAPWARTLASHSRAAYVLMEAVKWGNEDKANQAGIVVALKADLDADGYEEVIIRNDKLAVIITPRFGGRIIYAFYYSGGDDILFIGNPTDDWNWLETLNDFMDVPINHPGAMADHGFEHDEYAILSLTDGKSDEAELVITNKQKNSLAYGLTKRFSLKKRQSKMKIVYEHIPTGILPLSLDIGFSTDYLQLLREGMFSMTPYQNGDKKGFGNGPFVSWVMPQTPDIIWKIPRCPTFGHGVCLALQINGSNASFELGIERTNK